MVGLPQNRAQLKEWCLRKLGKPVNKINVADEQVEDRITEAIERFQEYHFDGVEKVYLKHKITGSTMRFTGALAFNYQTGEKITGQTSGAVGQIVSQADDDLSVIFITETGEFELGEVVTGASGSATISSAENGIVLGDKDNRYLPIDDSIISVLQVITMPGLFGGSLFSFSFQQALAALPIWPSGTLDYYYQTRQHLRLIENIFIGDKTIAFSRMMNQLQIEINWKTSLAVDDYIIIEAYKAINPETYRKVYASWFVREYSTSLIKKQWGQNLTKFNFVLLPGGMKVNGEEIYFQAEKELVVLEKRLRDEFQLPPRFFVG